MKEIIQESKSFKKTDSKESILTTNTYQPYRKYNKITYSLRGTFLNMIINGNTTIKKAARLLNINYSSAKTLVAAFKREAKNKFKLNMPQEGQQCQFKKIQKESLPKITLVTTVGTITTCEKQLFHSKIKSRKVAISHNIGSLLGDCN